MSLPRYNFNAGPSALPKQVRERTLDSINNFRGSGIGVLETSHRSKEFDALVEDTKAALVTLLGIPSTHSVIFCTGGATQQFSMVPLNLLPPGRCGNYLVTGVWGQKAFEEACRLGRAHVAASGASDNFCSIPRSWMLSADAAYLHYTSNNTIYGTQFHFTPDAGTVPLVCDASSDFCTNTIDFSKIALLYAGAQKNVGTAGITVVIAKNEYLASAPESCPLLLQYNTYYANNSLYNTPPTLSMSVLYDMLRWIGEEGGVQEMKMRAQARAAAVYEVLDAYDIYLPTAALADRSEMNICFRLPDEGLTKKFLADAVAGGFIGLAGHRNLGGIRVSLYNGCDPEAVTALCDFLVNWAKI